MIKSVLAKNFKGRSFEYPLAGKTLITGLNGAGKSAIVQALQLAIEGGVPGVNKTNPAIMEALAGESPTIYVEAVVENGEGPVRLGRQFARERNSVRQVFMIDRRRVDQNGFAVAAAGAPRIVAVDEFLAMSAKKMIAYLASLAGNADLNALADKIEREKTSLSTLQKKLAEAEAFISKTSEGLSRMDLPVGSLAEVQEEIKAREAELNEARNSLAEAAAKKKAEEEARAQRLREERRALQEKTPGGEDAPALPGNGQSPESCQHQGVLFPEPNQTLPPSPARESTAAAAVASIKAIVATIKEASCPTCRGTAGLLIAKRELRKWEAR